MWTHEAPTKLSLQDGFISENASETHPGYDLLRDLTAELSPETNDHDTPRSGASASQLWSRRWLH